MKFFESCPICNSHEIGEFNGRPKGKCTSCGGLERTRYLFMLLNRMGVLRPDISVLHMAPEPGLHSRISALTENYTPVDYDISQYTNWRPAAQFCDLSNLSGSFTGPYDLIIHNHVLEHVPCSVSKVVNQLQNRLKSTGVMLFSIPVRRNAFTREDLSPDLTHEQRTELFGQWDHMRIFGDRDVMSILKGPEGNNVSLVNPYDYVSKRELRLAGVPEVVSDFSGHSIFMVSPS